MKYGFVDHNGIDVKFSDQRLANVNLQSFLDCVDKSKGYSFEPNWPDADIIFAHATFDGSLNEEWLKYIIPHLSQSNDNQSRFRIFLVISSEDFDSPRAIVKKFEKDIIIFVIRLFNHSLIDGDKPDPIYINSLLGLRAKDAEYILDRYTNESRVDFSEFEKEKKKPSTRSPEECDALNKLFNKPANSDTLVSWYILAKTYELCKKKMEKASGEEEKKELKKEMDSLKEKDIWKVNDSWKNSSPQKASELLMDDLSCIMGTWKLKDSSKRETDRENAEDEITNPLKDFAMHVYGGGITADDLDSVWKALHDLFPGKKEYLSTKNPSAADAKGKDADSSQPNPAEKTSSSKKPSSKTAVRKSSDVSKQSKARTKKTAPAKKTAKSMKNPVSSAAKSKSAQTKSSKKERKKQGGKK